MGAYNPELSPKKRLVQSLARGRWKAAPYGAKISIDIASLTAGEALTPAGAFALGQIRGILVDVAHKAVDSKVEENIDAVQWDQEAPWQRRLSRGAVAKLNVSLDQGSRDVKDTDEQEGPKYGKDLGSGGSPGKDGGSGGDGGWAPSKDPKIDFDKLR